MGMPSQALHASNPQPPAPLPHTHLPACPPPHLPPQMNTDWAAVIDAWAVRFFHELDYR